MKPIALAGALTLVLAGCTASQQTVALNSVTIACQKDQQFQPLVLGVVSAAGALSPVAMVPGPTAVNLVSLDQMLVHPAVVAACEAAMAGSKPVAVAGTGK